MQLLARLQAADGCDWLSHTPVSGSDTRFGTSVGWGGVGFHWRLPVVR